MSANETDGSNRPGDARRPGDGRATQPYEMEKNKYTPTAGAGGDITLSPLTQFRVDAPFRPADWRHRLAVAIARHPDPRVTTWLRVRRADAWVEGLLACFADPAGLAHHPAARTAVLLRQANRGRRIEVEARLLAGQSSEDIGRKTGLDAAVVAWFEAVRFNCRDRLGHPGYVRHTLLGEPPTAIGSGLPLELARWYAYFGGPLVLEAVLPVLRSPSDRPGDPTAAAIWTAALASVTARALPLAGDAPALLRLAQAEQGREARTRSGGLVLGPLRPPTGA